DAFSNDLDARMLLEHFTMTISTDRMVWCSWHAHHDCDFAFTAQHFDQTTGSNLGLLAEIGTDLRDAHAFRRHGIKQHQRNFLVLRFVKRGAIARWIEQIECETVRTGCKCAVYDLVLLNNVCALWC